MRALLTPEIAPRMGIVLFRPGSELMPLFMQGRVLLEPEPERYSSFASGAVPAASQPLADDPAVRAVFRNEAVIRRAGGVECLESWLLREKGCQWPHSDWHSENMTTMRHAPGAIRLCWHCDNQLRDQFTERLESMATDNCARWVLSVVRRDLGFDDSHVVTMPELCWWLIRNDLADALPESAARKALRLPKPVVPSVTRESDLVPSVPATSIIQDKAKKVKELCQHCHGKGEVSTACRGCKGKGIVLDEKRTRLHGTPVYKICGRCNGNRFSRLPTTLARHHVQKLVPDLTDYQWYKGYADVIDKLVTKCWQEEAYAEIQLRNVTR
ncbi:antitermination protein [Escherichia coli]